MLARTYKSPGVPPAAEYDTWAEGIKNETGTNSKDLKGRSPPPTLQLLVQIVEHDVG
jgi:hypothetical protein